jgi:hypothetical protein
MAMATAPANSNLAPVAAPHHVSTAVISSNWGEWRAIRGGRATARDRPTPGGGGPPPPPPPPPRREVGGVDDRRFDVVARTLTEHASRRGALRGLVATVAALFAVTREAGTSAHHAKTPLGGACRLTSQCLHHAVVTRRARVRPSREAVYCADNGFRYDGSLNCCRNEGGSCRLDEHCCGSRHFCRNKVCTYLD